jgi:hypothetical protein
VPSVRNPEWECPNGHHPGNRRLRIGRDGLPVCPICTAKPANRAFIYAAGYAGCAAIFGLAAWFTSGIINVILVVVAVLLGAAALWIAAFVGGLLVLFGVAKRITAEKD